MKIARKYINEYEIPSKYVTSLEDYNLIILEKSSPVTVIDTLNPKTITAIVIRLHSLYNYIDMYETKLCEIIFKNLAKFNYSWDINVEYAHYDKARMRLPARKLTFALIGANGKNTGEL